jgi:predicted transglutaminase-like protease
MEKVEAIAKAFSRIMREACIELDLENKLQAGTLISTINKENNKPENEKYCATHNYFDANMGMLAAFEEVNGKEPNFLWDNSTPESEEDMKTWNDAWDMAKKNNFWA